MSDASQMLDSAAAGNPEAFVRHLVADAIEAAYHEEFGHTKLNYYYDVFRTFPAGVEAAALRDWCPNPWGPYDDGTLAATRTVWHGSGLIRFVRTVQQVCRRRYADDGITIYATSSHCKSGIRDYWDHDGERTPEDDVNVIWIGDVGRDGHMASCNSLWAWVWNHVLNSTAQGWLDAEQAIRKEGAENE